MTAAAVHARRAERRILQLACLGLPGSAAMPALLREMHGLIPTYSNTFYWVHRDGRLANVYDENPGHAEIAPLYLEHFCDRLEKAVHPGFTAAARHGRGVLCNEGFFTVDERTLHRSEFYNCIMRPQRYHHVMQLYLRSGGHPLGIVQLQRSAGEPAFTAHDRRRLGGLAGMLVHALQAEPTVVYDEWVDSGDSGLLITDIQGRPLSFSPHGRRLLFLAGHDIVCPGRTGPLRLPPALRALCRNLQAAQQGRRAPPPTTCLHNRWGRFEFRAYPLQGSEAGAGRIGISVRQLVPTPLQLLRGTRDLALSRRQTEVALQLAMGHSHRAIAECLGIARSTVISHSRWIYARLGIHDSRQLRTYLLQAAAKASP